MATIQYYGTGRRKTSTARVFLRPGKGTITINRNTLDKSFPTQTLQLIIRQPLVVTGDRRAIRRPRQHGRRRRRRPGRARADCAGPAGLRRRVAPGCAPGFYRATRAKERKSDGMAGARKRFQFSKR